MTHDKMEQTNTPRVITHPLGASLYYKDSGMTIRMNLREAKMFLKDYQQPADFSAPETVHIEITGECNLNCPYCYVPRGKMEEGLTGEVYRQLFRELGDMGVFQITFGGGEPFLRDDMVDLAREADRQGINVTVTTNGTLFEKFDSEDLKVFRQINISYHKEPANQQRDGEESGNDKKVQDEGMRDVTMEDTGKKVTEEEEKEGGWEGEQMGDEEGDEEQTRDHKMEAGPMEGGKVEMDRDLVMVREAVARVVDAGIPCGISFIMSRDYWEDLPGIVRLVKEFDISILLLSYKPIHENEENVVSLQEIRRIAYSLRDKGVKVAIDSMLSNECFMSERLATISHTGEVYPCSFVRQSMGNITEKPFPAIWKSRPPKSPCPYAYLNE